MIDSLAKADADLAALGWAPEATAVPATATGEPADLADVDRALAQLETPDAEAGTTLSGLAAIAQESTEASAQESTQDHQARRQRTSHDTLPDRPAVYEPGSSALADADIDAMLAAELAPEGPTPEGPTPEGPTPEGPTQGRQAQALPDPEPAARPPSIPPPLPTPDARTAWVFPPADPLPAVQPTTQPTARPTTSTDEIVELEVGDDGDLLEVGDDEWEEL